MTTVLGISGGPNVIGTKPSIDGLSRLFFHDAAAALIVDGQVVYAVEEERVSRIKHTNSFPSGAIRACLEQTGTLPNRLDHIAYFFEEEFCDVEFRRVSSELGTSCPASVRLLLTSHLCDALRIAIGHDKIRFVRHHAAHAAAAYHASTFGECLIIVIDGRGERESISVFKTINGVRELLITYSITASPGFFYRQVTRLLGFGEFDEYKVMGLAPYGDPSRFSALLEPLYSPPLGDDGMTLDHEALPRIVRGAGIPARASGDPIAQTHKDFAAAAQAVIERACLDLARLWQSRTGLRQLCLVGGVAHNCRMNGVVARSGMFDAIYVHPASHDAGAAVGAALDVSDSLGEAGGKTSAAGGSATHTFSPFLGLQIDQEGSDEQRAALDNWSEVLDWKRSSALHATVASAIAEGQIVGWARGRAEFGPRALGARSIIADPRPRENWTRINKAIKKREGFRPFAPAVCEDSADRYFELPPAICNLGEMCFTVNVRPPWRETLGAVTHVDGSARIQVVAPVVNKDFWTLIKAFESQTGIGVLLNTSFNHSSEPIVDSPKDVVRTFLTTDLDLLVLGPYIVRKRGSVRDVLGKCRMEVTLGTEFVLRMESHCARIGTFIRGAKSYMVSKVMVASMLRDGGGWKISDLLDRLEPAHIQDVIQEIGLLWEARVIDLVPKPRQ